MDGLQIPNLQALKVTLCGLDGAVPEDLREVEEISSVPQVHHGERVPKGVWAEPHTADAELLSHRFEVPLKIPYRDKGVTASAKQ